MSLEQRLARLSPALSAQERAILILEAWKDGREEDPSWRRSMPREQSHAFNRYIELMNRVNLVLGRMIGVLNMQAEALEQREAWLMSMTLWMEHIEEIRRAVWFAVREPVTETEHAGLVEAARDEWVPVQELAGFLVGERDFSPEDLEEDEHGEPVVRDEVWDRASAEEEKRLRALAAAGKIATRGKGKALKLQHRALQHFSHDVGAVSEDYVDYRIVPDGQAEEVEREREALRRLQGALDWQPTEEDVPSLPERMLQGLRETTASRLISCWLQVRCVDLIVAEIGEAFNGIDPWRPVFREKMDNTRSRLEAIRDHLRLLYLEVELREPLPEELDEVRGWLNEAPATS